MSIRRISSRRFPGTKKDILSQIRELLQRATTELTESDSARLDAQLLLAEVLGVDRTWLITWSDKDVEKPKEIDFLSLLARRKAGEPIAHILGRREFWGRDFACNKNTLIPRPDTERLIELILTLDLPKQAKILDLGTGTGCIALTLAAERPEWQVHAVDQSSDALKVAEQNKASLGLENVELIQGDWFEPVSSELGFDLIVSNPPYIDPESPYLKEGDVRFEPDLALTSDRRGIAALEHIIGAGKTYLNPNGWLAVEHGFDQAAPVHRLFVESDWQKIQQAKDLADLDRCTMGQFICRL